METLDSERRGWNVESLLKAQMLLLLSDPTNASLMPQCSKHSALNTTNLSKNTNAQTLIRKIKNKSLVCEVSGLGIKPHFKVETVETDAGGFKRKRKFFYFCTDTISSTFGQCLQWSRGLLISCGDSNPQMNYWELLILSHQETVPIFYWSSWRLQYFKISDTSQQPVRVRLGEKERRSKRSLMFTWIIEANWKQFTTGRRVLFFSSY